MDLAEQRKEIPAVLRVFLAVIAVVLLVSAAGIIFSWIYFPSYAREFIAAHPKSFEGIDSEERKFLGVGLGLGIRSLVALTWVATYVYLRRLVHRADKSLPQFLLWYPVISCAGYGYLLTQPSLGWQLSLRWFQFVLCLMFAVVALLPASRQSVRDYVAKHYVPETESDAGIEPDAAVPSEKRRADLEGGMRNEAGKN